MRGVDAAILACDLRELDQFVSFSKTRRHVLQRSRETKSAVQHRLGHELLHLVQLLRGWRAIVVTNYIRANLSSADERAEIHARALFLEAFEIFVERAPID